MQTWTHCKNILCIRADNMGDLLMSTPAIRALKQTFSCSITVLTSSMASSIAGYIPEIDEVLTYDLPWIKTSHAMEAGSFFHLAEKLKEHNFDAAVVFTVYSQNPLPAVMLAYLAGIPLRLAYCRENPYELLTHWVPDKEPYSLLRHQVQRDLDLVATVGAAADHDSLSVRLPDEAWPGVVKKLLEQGIDIQKPWLIMHAGVSEKKREYPVQNWIKAGKKLAGEWHYQVLLTGTAGEMELTGHIQASIGPGAVCLAGKLSLEEYMLLIMHAPLVVSVNTGTVHIAAATSTPVVVLYALTNPQHLPWKASGKVLLYDVPEIDRSRNEVIRYVHRHLFIPHTPMVSADELVRAAADVLANKDAHRMPEMIPLRQIPVE